MNTILVDIWSKYRTTLNTHCFNFKLFSFNLNTCSNYTSEMFEGKVKNFIRWIEKNWLTKVHDYISQSYSKIEC